MENLLHKTGAPCDHETSYDSSFSFADSTISSIGPRKAAAPPDHGIFNDCSFSFAETTFPSIRTPCDHAICSDGCFSVRESRAPGHHETIYDSSFSFADSTISSMRASCDHEIFNGDPFSLIKSTFPTIGTPHDHETSYDSSFSFADSRSRKAAAPRDHEIFNDCSFSFADSTFPNVRAPCDHAIFSDGCFSVGKSTFSTAKEIRDHEILTERFFASMEPSPSDLRDFKRETFNAHNNYRTMHGCPPLVMSEELSGMAQGWAEKLAEKGFLQYSENPGLGENISLVDLAQPSKKGEQIVKEWYKEINNYNYSKPGWKRGAYRFSQVLWKSTTEIGVGVCKIPGQNRAYLVVNYRPAGNNNMPGEFERNVLPPQKKAAAADDNANMRKNINRR